MNTTGSPEQKHTFMTAVTPGRKEAGRTELRKDKDEAAPGSTRQDNRVSSDHGGRRDRSGPLLGFAQGSSA